MDTDTIVAAMRSSTGASAALLRVARSGRVTLPATAPLCLEYEDVCSRPEHVEAARFSPADLAVFLGAVIDLVEPVNGSVRHRHPAACGSNAEDLMTTRTSTYPLHLPVSIKDEAEKLAAAEGTSLNQFVVMAVAEKVAALRTASYFAERRGRGNWNAFD